MQNENRMKQPLSERINVIGFDADDTLWVNEPFYQECEEKFCRLLEPYAGGKDVHACLLETDIENVGLYGYGIKGFMLSMVETAIRISGGKVSAETLTGILTMGKGMFNHPLILLEGAKDVLATLSARYRLVLATKGDLLDQQRKLERSGLGKYFERVEVMSDKKETDYQQLLKRTGCRPEEFLMAGNSVKSDILPVLSIGAWAAHIPYEITWEHEVVEAPLQHERCFELKKLSDLLPLLG